MARMLTVLLVEDDENACLELQAAVNEFDDIAVVGITSSSMDAMEYVLDSLPDAIILDLELHDGTGNGLLFLQKLKEAKLSYEPYILVTTNNSSSLTYEAARQLGADFILSKHQSDYSAKGVVDFLRMMKHVIHSKSETAQHAALMESQEQQKKRIRKRILAELNKVGISPKLMGYQYLTDGIQLIMEGETSLICTKLGKAYGKTEPSVERAIQSAINKAWRTSDTDNLLEHYTAKIDSDKGVPTITEFMFYYASKIQSEI